MPSARPAKSPPPGLTWKKALAAGVLFEIALGLLTFLLPEGTWLAIKTRSFLIWSHYPLIFLTGCLGPLLLPLVAIAMAGCWAFAFYWGGRFLNLGLARFGISRRMKLILAFIVAALMILDSFQNTPIPFAASPRVKTVVEGNTAFALDLYQKLKDQPGNVFFSPYSISTALAMTCAGARGQTETEIAATAHFNLPPDELHAAFGELAGRMNRIERRWDRITLATANSLWCQQGHPFTSRFLDLLDSCYRAKAESVDFVGNPKDASDRINAWAGKATRGKINSVIEPARFTSLSRLVLCNAIYLKGQWAAKFKPKDTKPQPFYVSTEETVTVPMMEQNAAFMITYAEDFPLELLELPYFGGDLSMVILLPQAVDGLPELERELSAEKLGRWLARLDRADSHEAMIRLPRFKTSREIELAEILQSMGMPSAFNDRSDFSGMDGRTGRAGLYISDAIHSAVVEVNEAGTEAAAVTLVHIASRGMTDSFNADHPFLFLIRGKGSGSILFLGRIVDPTK